jgi:hypothetical protein
MAQEPLKLGDKTKRHEKRIFPKLRTKFKLRTNSP